MILGDREKLDLYLAAPLGEVSRASGDARP